MNRTLETLAIAGAALLLGAGALGQTARAEEQKQGIVRESFNGDMKWYVYTDKSLADMGNLEKFTVSGVDYFRAKYGDDYPRILTLALALGDKSFKALKIEKAQDESDSAYQLKAKKVYFSNAVAQMDAVNPELRKKDPIGMKYICMRMAQKYIEAKEITENGKTYKVISFAYFNECMQAYNLLFAPLEHTIMNNPNLSTADKEKAVTEYAVTLLKGYKSPNNYPLEQELAKFK